jgi:hypothetical protein
VGGAISVDFADPPGVYTIQANGTGLNEQPLQLTGRYTVLSLAPTIGPTQFATPTFSVTCPLPQAFISASALSPGQTTTFGGSGFRPGSFVTVEYVGPGGAFGERFFSPPQLGPAGSTCNLSSLLVVDPSTPLGHYRAILTGPNATGFQVSATAEFDVVAFTGAATPTPFAPAPPPPPPVGPPPPPLPPGSVAPLSIDQTLTLVDGARVPAVGEASIYEHVIRMRNTSSSAVDVRVAVGGRGVVAAPGMGPLAQGQPVGASFATEYSSDSVVLATSANVGQATVRGNSVIWEGQLAAGQSLELRTTVQQTPSTALSLNQPIRGQTLSVVDQRGTTLSVPPLARPVLPPEQRLVQPAPPPVDPVTGSRYFPDTGFAIADDNIWVYYHRRGGMKTFGGPISRVFTLFGVRAQLFERGMLQVDQTGGVSVVNLLEWPFLPYETLGDVSLPAVDEGLIQLAPDPSQPGYGAASQEFVGTFAAEEFEGIPTRFYTAFLTTVLFRDAFFDGRGDPSLVPGFSLEIWGVPTSWPTYQALSPDTVDPAVVLQRFQRGVMKRDNRAGTTSGIPLGSYVRGVLAGDVALADVAGSNVLWAQYNPAAVDWVDRADELPDTNFVLAFEPD